jgi:branched-chain amino acid transport system substrate-binding protein
MPLGSSDFSSVLTKIRNLDVNQVVMCLAGFDTAACAKQFVSFGLHKTMKISGIFLEDAYASALPLDELRGSVFGLTWSPYVTPASELLAKKIKAVNNGSVSFRNYMAYISTQQLTNRIEAAGTTRAETLVEAFANHRFDADKATEAVWRGCDHQCVQDTYAGAIVGSDRYKKTGYLFDVVADVRGPQVAGTCSDADAAAAQAIMASQTIPSMAH